MIRKVPHYDLNEKLLTILHLYEHNHDGGETFRDFAARAEPRWWTRRLEEDESTADEPELTGARG